MKITLALINVMAGATLFAWPMLCFLTVFLFDAPGSGSDPRILAIATAVLGYPAPVVLGNVLFWRNFRRSAWSVLSKYTVISLLGPVVAVLLAAVLLKP